MMVQLIFSLRFQSQLRRTRPKLLRNLETSIIRAIAEFGGKVHIEHKLIHASFGGETIGFWLDILCVLEAVKDALERASSELYGHICILGQDIREEDIPALSRSLPSDLWGTGIWCAPELRKFLESFIDFDDAPDISGPGENPGAGYAQIRAIREFGEPAEVQTRERNNSEKIRQYLKPGSRRNTVIVGDENIGKREGLYRYCADQMKGLPPLVIRFYPGANTVSAFVDALAPEIREILEPGKRLTELEELGKALFKERLRDELSEFIIKQGERFLCLLLEAYRLGVEKREAKPALILENIQNADPLSRLIIAGMYFSLPSRERITVYGTCTGLEPLEPWEEMFPRIIKFTPEKTGVPPMPDIPWDLWEMAYCCRLLGRYFPPFLFPQLLKEEGKNPTMIEKSLLMLSRLWIKESPAFLAQAENVLGEGTGRIRRVVRNRLLAWVEDFRLKPCYRLLRALADLEGRGSDNLVLDAICGDIMYGTYRGIEGAIEDGSFAAVAGEDRVPMLLAIIKTQKALCYGDRNEINDAFKAPFSGALQGEFPGFKAKMYANIAAYHVGNCEAAAAADSIKQAMLTAQNENGGRFLAHIYRIFSLAEFAGRHLSDAIDYFAFAVENAEKTEDQAELGISAYYAAAAHFIFGNISKAGRLARQGREAALAAALPDWADRCRFLEGRFCFEIGRYQEALDIFKDLGANYLGAGTGDFKQTLGAWIYRANIYLHNTGVSHSGGLDALLFELEGAFLTGEYRKSLELIALLEKTPLDERHIVVERPDWRSGFCQCELMLFSLRDLWDRMLCTYRALALSHLSGGEAYEKDEAVRELQRVMRDELPETDPNDAFYFYAYYRILKRTGAPEVDMNTAISIAFKRLQRRASRIDENDAKRSFQSFHYWNGALAAAAREHKLI
ncbi:MAG: hypothetical protein LBO65_04915 [Spirochaetaceae bacterium]|jgi:hypothetical protein|nr:hypothetical protein [Spirochaetaceae bacterium]